MGRLPNEDWAKNMVFKFADVIVVSTNINALEFKYDFACIRINVKTTVVYLQLIYITAK